MLVSALGRLAGWQMHGVHNLPDDISPTEDALVSQQVKPPLSLVEDNPTSWRLLVFNFSRYYAGLLELRPVVDVAGGMPQRRAV